MAQIAQLYHLQEIDNELRQGKERLRQIRLALADQASLLAARRAAADADASLAEWRRQQRELNQALQDLGRKLATSEQRLYSGNVKNPKELNDLQLSVDALGRQRGSAEDELLEAMVMVDDLENEAAGAHERLAQVESAWQETESRLTAEKATLDARLAALSQDRRETVGHIPASLLREYDDLAKRQRNAVAVAGLRGGICQACGVTVASHTARAAEQGELANCGSCDRILYPI